MKTVFYFLFIVLVIKSGQARVVDHHELSDITHNEVIDVDKDNKDPDIHEEAVHVPTTEKTQNEVQKIDTSTENVVKLDETTENVIKLETTEEVVKLDETTENVIPVKETTESVTNPANADPGENDTVNTGPETPKPLILTPLIKEQRFEEARAASRVDPTVFLGTESYSGFVTVNETYNSNMFFWYFPVMDMPVNSTPWIIWLQGGPGASSMTGLFDEIGPVTVQNNQLQLNPHSWGRDHSLLFLDNPVGTGFSFTSDDGYVTNMDTYGTHMYTALRQIVQIFPELRTAPLFIAGESYAGKYTPALAMQVHKHKNETGGDINLQGISIGNPYVDPSELEKLTQPFYYYGVLEDKQLELLRPLIDHFKKLIADHNSVEAKNAWTNFIYAMLMMAGHRHAYNFLKDDNGAGGYKDFLNQPSVREAIHVGNKEFNFISFKANMMLAPDFLSSSKAMFEELLEHYRVLAYCGQLDMMISCAVSAEQYRTWEWSRVDEFRKATRYPYMFQNHLAGYRKAGGGFTEAVIRGAGHMAPMDAPAPLQHLVAQWTRGLPLSRYPFYLDTDYLDRYIHRHSNNTIFM